MASLPSTGSRVLFSTVCIYDFVSVSVCGSVGLRDRKRCNALSKELCRCCSVSWADTFRLLLKSRRTSAYIPLFVVSGIDGILSSGIDNFGFCRM